MNPVDEAAITYSDSIFIAIRDDVVNSVIVAGSKLNEAELSTTYKVSRAIIRESINQLENANLVERKANIGAQVITFKS
jgi:DNA-binding GntR family transcriptional regulator